MDYYCLADQEFGIGFEVFVFEHPQVGRKLFWWIGDGYSNFVLITAIPEKWFMADSSGEICKENELVLLGNIGQSSDKIWQRIDLCDPGQHHLYFLKSGNLTLGLFYYLFFEMTNLLCLKLHRGVLSPETGHCLAEAS